MAKKVTITLSVNASILYALASPTQAQIDNESSLSDDNAGNSPNQQIENFTSNVYVNNDVKWQGETVDSGYSVAITSIVYEATGTDVNFFDSTTIDGTGGRTGNVTAKVKNDSGLVNKLDVYTINFRVYASGNNYKSFSIDPKLQGKSNT